MIRENRSRFSRSPARTNPCGGAIDSGACPDFGGVPRLRLVPRLRIVGVLRLQIPRFRRFLRKRACFPTCFGCFRSPSLVFLTFRNPHRFKLSRFAFRAPFVVTACKPSRCRHVFGCASVALRLRFARGFSERGKTKTCFTAPATSVRFPSRFRASPKPRR